VLRQLIHRTVRTLKLGSYPYRAAIGAVPRPNYAYVVFQAAQLAARLRQPRVSILEFGVAGGNGLLALEQHAEEIEKIFPVRIDVYGFDIGTGLQTPMDHKDLPYHWRAGFFKMDLDALQRRLKRAKLVMGDVAQTAVRFIEDYNPAPIGGVAQDLDFYSSTVASLRVFDSDVAYFLPRVFCYFDDTIGGDIELYNDFTGQRLAIHEFNAQRERVKLSPIYYLRAVANAPTWHHQMWAAHLFDHPNYNTFISTEDQQLTLQSADKRRP
jgi:hypothetical protein